MSLTHGGHEASTLECASICLSELPLVKIVICKHMHMTKSQSNGIIVRIRGEPLTGGISGKNIFLSFLLGRAACSCGVIKGLAVQLCISHWGYAPTQTLSKIP